MYPFLVFDLPYLTTDDAVAERYRELITQYPPDRDAVMFNLIQEAWAALRTERDRARTYANWKPVEPERVLDATIEHLRVKHRRRPSHELLVQTITRSLTP